MVFQSLSDFNQLPRQKGRPCLEVFIAHRLIDTHEHIHRHLAELRIEDGLAGGSAQQWIGESNSDC